MTMITPSYLGETIEYSSLHACRSTLEDPTVTHTDETDSEASGVEVSLRCTPGDQEQDCGRNRRGGLKQQRNTGFKAAKKDNLAADERR